ncbi:hypothetical protein [Myxosarcina sp. GI1]|uniref:hypothetical protein n=1 Tax=Myxosarcina sp. GI1 TaxID=1541065 RepID=UPI0005672F1B|nr:hypothetical protein [Myxosarcina sp. GI1]
MFNYKLNKLRFIVIVLSIFTIYLSWKKILANVPEPLPEQPTLEDKNRLARGTYYQVSIPPAKKDKYVKADYRIWVPDNVKSIRGLIVKQHGCGDAAAASGLAHANDLQWQALAFKHHFALLGTRYSTHNEFCDDWAYIDRGSEQAFLKAIAAFAERSRHPELVKVPWALWGHSGGADWGAQMLQKYFNRTLALVAVRCGGATFPKRIDSKLFGVPVLFAVAERENTLIDECRDLPLRVFKGYRKQGALWAVAVEANTAHEAGDTRLLAIPYFDAIATARLAKDNNNLFPINQAKGWLADLTTNKIASIGRFESKPSQAGWLPNEETARKWKEYVATGKIDSNDALERPKAVKVERLKPNTALISWKYTPDLKNGLPYFKIYRNDSLIQTFQGQEHNFGDAPEPVNVVLEFRDHNSSLNATYTVEAFEPSRFEKKIYYQIKKIIGFFGKS